MSRQRSYNPIFFLVLILAGLAHGAAVAVQVSGSATLIEASDHAGTTIVFHADSPTAETDSTVTDANGDYGLDVQPGAYDVEFRHEGYVGQEQLNLLLTADTVLDSVELLPDYRILSGAISGVLGAGKEYFVEGHLSVAASDTLVIEPGVRLNIMGEYSINIYGLLLAEGTEAAPIRIVSGRAAPSAYDWGGIVFALHSDDNSRLAYCEIAHGDWAVISHLNSITLSHCTIRDARYGVYLFPDYRPESAHPVIEDCLIENTVSPGIMVGGGIYAATIARTTFRSCGRAITIFGAGDRDQTTLTDCVIEDCGDYSIYCASAFYGSIEGTRVSGGTIGIFLESSAPVISRCIIEGFTGTGIYLNGSSPDIHQCDIFGGFNGLVFSSPSIEPSINSCIIDCAAPLGTNATNSANSQIFYNCLVGSTQYYPANLGVPVLTNANGDACDIYFNILLDPEVTDPDGGDFSLIETSPCIDAGSPLLATDPDGTVADIGAIYFEQGSSGVIEVPQGARLTVAQNHPNPFNPSTSIRFELPEASTVHLAIYDVAGRLVRNLVAGSTMAAGPHTVIWDGSDNQGRSVNSGVFFYRVETADEQQTRAMTMLK